MNPPPIDPGAHDRIMREARLKEMARAEGVRIGEARASAKFERRLAELEERVTAMWSAFCTDETRQIRRPEGHNSG